MYSSSNVKDDNAIQKCFCTFKNKVYSMTCYSQIIRLKNRSTLAVACKIINQTPTFHIILPKCTAYLFWTQIIYTKMTLYCRVWFNFFTTSCEKNCWEDNEINFSFYICINFVVKWLVFQVSMTEIQNLVTYHGQLSQS